MTSPASDRRTALTDAQRWAAARLELEHDGSLASAQAALARKLAEDDFQFAAYQDQAVQLLARDVARADADDDGAPSGTRKTAAGPVDGGPLPAAIERHADARLEEATAEFLHDCVERFAGQFFALPPEQRTAGWHHWHGQALRIVEVLARLDALRPGLDLVPAPIPHAPPNAETLRDRLLEQFTMRPADRGAVRRQLMVEVEQDPRAWANAASWLRRRPEAALLDERLLQRLIAWRRIGKYDHVRTFFRSPSQIQRKRSIRDLAAVTFVAVVILGILGSISA